MTKAEIVKTMKEQAHLATSAQAEQPMTDCSAFWPKR
jgi:hypothetical protein